MDISRQSEDRIKDFLWMQEEVGPGALATKIAMNLKNPYLFKEFMSGEGVDPNRTIYYAYAAGLISRAEADYLKNPLGFDDNGNDDENGGGVL